MKYTPQCEYVQLMAYNIEWHRNNSAVHTWSAYTGSLQIGQASAFFALEGGRRVSIDEEKALNVWLLSDVEV